MTVFSIWSATGQNLDLTVYQIIENQKTHKSNTQLFESIANVDFDEVLESFKKHTNDSLAETRMAAYNIIYAQTRKKDNKKIRTQSVTILTKGLKDKDAGIGGLVGNYLSEYAPDEFNTEARYEITQWVKTKPSNFRIVLRLSGYLGIEELIYNYKQMLSDGLITKTYDKWLLYITMARLGDQESLNHIMSKINKLQVSNDVLYEIVPDLAYIRTHETFDYIFQIILSDEKNCLPSNPSLEVPIICAYRAIEAVAKYIENFPIPVGIDGMPEFDDYENDLATVRQWIFEQGNNYQLISTKF
jgi:hypothetical protein